MHEFQGTLLQSTFSRFHRFPFHKPLCLWLISQPNKAFSGSFCFKIKEDAFQMKHEQL